MRNQHDASRSGEKQNTNRGLQKSQRRMNSNKTFLNADFSKTSYVTFRLKNIEYLCFGITILSQFHMITKRSVFLKLGL